MFEDIFGFASETFAAIILTVSLAVSVHICHGSGTKKARESFIGGLLLLMSCYQLYNLILASTHIPQFPYMYDSSLRRYDCIASGKGGKRPGFSLEQYDLNPCYCHSEAVCTLTNGTVLTNNENCPEDESLATCVQKGNLTISLYISNERNCQGGAGIQCTKEQPCEPCDRNSLSLWGSGRCRSCYSDFRGDCNFNPDDGPYCRVSPDSKSVEPCKTCCTEYAPLIIDGICY